MSDDDIAYVLEMREERADIESDEFDKIRAEAPTKDECLELFDHARE